MAQSGRITTRDAEQQEELRPSERLRALRLVDDLCDAPGLPSRLEEVAMSAWKWLVHNLRVAMWATTEATDQLLTDPAALRRLIWNSPIALLTTRDRAGALHQQPMMATRREFDGEIWFPTPETAPVLEHVRARAPVQVTYVDADSSRSLVLSGVARVCRRAHGSAGTRRLFRPETVSHDATFIRVDVISADVWG